MRIMSNNAERMKQMLERYPRTVEYMESRSRAAGDMDREQYNTILRARQNQLKVEANLEKARAARKRKGGS